MALEAIGLQAVLQDANFQAGLKRYQSGVGQMEKSTDSAAGMLTRLGSIASGAVVIGIGAATAAFAGAIAVAKMGLDATLQWGEQLDKLSDQFGFTGQQASGWAFLMNKVGLTVDEGSQGLNYFTKQLADFGKTTKDGSLQVTPFLTALQKLGVNGFDPATGKAKTFDQIMPQIMDKFKALPAGINASALAMDLFGARGGTKFLDFLRQGGAGLKDATEKAKALGLVLSTDEVNAAEEFGFSMNELNLGLLGFKNTIGKAVLPIAKELVDWLNKNAIPVLIDIAKEYAPKLVEAAKRIGDWIRSDGIPRLRDLVSWFSRLGDWIRGTGLPWLKRFTDAFKRGGLAGVLQAAGNLVGALLDQLRKAWPQISATLRGWGVGFWGWVTEVAIPMAGEKLGAIAAAIGKWAQDNGPTIASALKGWGTQFWGWVTNDALPLVGAKMGEVVAGIQKWVTDNGPAIGAAFTGWKDRFWDWLTGPGGAIFQAAGNIGQVAGKIAEWLGNNWDGLIKPTLLGWANMFWEWLTDDKSGALVRVTENMVKLTDTINAWLESNETKKTLNQIGQDIAQRIIDGIGDLFSNQKNGDNLLLTLARNLWNGAQNNIANFMKIPNDIGVGFWTRLLSLMYDPAEAAAFANAIMSTLTNAVTIVIQGLPGLIQRIFDAWNALWGGGPVASPTGAPTGLTPGILPSMQHGGFVPRDMFARLHRGEYVLPASTVNRIVNNNQRTISPGAVVVTINGGTSLTVDQVETVTYRAIRRVMERAA